MKESEKRRKRVSSVLGRTFEIVRTILFIAVFSTLCIMLYSLRKDQSVSIFNYRFIRIITDSMAPTFNPGTCIIIRNEGLDDLEIGDIITFISYEDQIYNEYNTHRIYDMQVNEKTGQKEYITKGDRFTAPDNRIVRTKDIVGRFVCKVPFSKAINFIILELSNSMVYFVIIMLPLILCLLSYIKQLIWLIAFGNTDERK